MNIEELDTYLQNQIIQKSAQLENQGLRIKIQCIKCGALFNIDNIKLLEAHLQLHKEYP